MVRCRSKNGHQKDIMCSNEVGSMRYVGVIRFVFHVLQLLLIGFTQRNLCCISISTMKHQHKSHSKLDLP